MKVLITGATGLIGKEIVKQCLDGGWEVHYLTRSRDKIENKSNYKGFLWNVEKNEIDKKCFEGVECIINLAGSTIAKRWSQDYKKIILNSRIDVLKLLRKSIDAKSTSIRQIISASAVGVYPDSKTKYYKESSKIISNTFLGGVVEKWEEEVEKFEALNINIAKVRIGLVLSEKDGALPQIIKPVKLYAGAVFGAGDQWQSWIHLHDLAAIFMFISKNNLSGTYNGVAPHPVTNKSLIYEVAEALDKPIILPNIPRIAMKMLLGEMHILLFESQRVCSDKIEERGFQFKYPNLNPALKELLQ